MTKLSPHRVLAEIYRGYANPKADVPFTGNAAIIVISAEKYSEEQCAKINSECNVNNGANIYKVDEQNQRARITYSDKVSSVNFCGHATEVAAEVLYQKYGWQEFTLITELGMKIKVETRS